MMPGFLIIEDTWADAWQPYEHDGEGRLVVYATRQQALAQIIEALEAQLREARAGGREPSAVGVGDVAIVPVEVNAAGRVLDATDVTDDFGQLGEFIAAPESAKIVTDDLTNGGR